MLEKLNCTDNTLSKDFKNWLLNTEFLRFVCKIKLVMSIAVYFEESGLSGMLICYVLAQQLSNNKYFGHSIAKKGKTSN